MDKSHINIPDAKIARDPHTCDDLLQACEGDPDKKQLLSTVSEELARGIHFIKHHPRSVTIFGSARFEPGHPFYEQARSLSHRIAKELSYTIVTGGGPGIMEAGNRGAADVNGNSIAFTIELPQEQRVNPYVKEHAPFRHFFSRKVALSFSAEAYVYFPGGFGTMDEFFEILTLVQTHKIPRVPIILVGKEFWSPIDTFFKEVLCKKYSTIDEGDTSLYVVTDDEEQILRLIKEAPPRDE